MAPPWLPLVPDAPEPDEDQPLPNDMRPYRAFLVPAVLANRYAITARAAVLRRCVGPWEAL